MSSKRLPLLVEFAGSTVLHREIDRRSQLPIVGNGPPGTFVVFPDGLRVSLPTDQVIFADDTRGYASVGFGGMVFVRVERGMLVFSRVRDLYPEEQLSPSRSSTMKLETSWVSSVLVEGVPVWPVPV